jgi:hypothetical protein
MDGEVLKKSFLNKPFEGEEFHLEVLPNQTSPGDFELVTKNEGNQIICV